MRVTGTSQSMLGIHRELLVHASVLMIAGVLVMAAGTLVLLAIFVPQVGTLFGGLNAGVRVLFLLVGGFFFWLGYIACIATPLHYRFLTRTVFSTPPKRVRLRLSEERDSDSTNFYVHLGEQTAPHPARRPRWISRALLDTPMEGLAYFDASKNLAAIRLEQGLIWIT